jgi:type IV secretory pathway VirB4 component
MPIADPEKRKEYMREYHKNNKKKIKEQKKEYYVENKEQIDEKKKEYDQTEKGKKTHRISNWKSRGIICDDWDTLYNKYLTTLNCEDCDCELVEGYFGANKRCLDHNHETGEVRGIVCNRCNLMRG